MLHDVLMVLVTAGITGAISAIGTVAAIKVELRWHRADIDRHEVELREYKQELDQLRPMPRGA
jgi:hypothetical protein